MKRKKFFTLIAVACTVIISVFVLTACGEIALSQIPRKNLKQRQ